jgi:hypothetical protein
MASDVSYIELEFANDDERLHAAAADLVISKKSPRCILKQGPYSYKIEGGTGGSLCYRKGNTGDWIDIARWVFYGASLTVIYRKPSWLRPMYERLFTNMNFASVGFGEHTISVTDIQGETMRHKRFHLIPPGAMTKVLVDKLHFTQQHAERLMNELKISGA